MDEDYFAGENWPNSILCESTLLIHGIMGDPLLINVSNLLTGQRQKFMVDSLFENGKEYCLIPKPHPFLSLISHQEITTAYSHGWITITQYCWNTQQLSGTWLYVTLDEKYQSRMLYIRVSRSPVTECVFGLHLVLLALLAVSISVRASSIVLRTVGKESGNDEEGEV